MKKLVILSSVLAVTCLGSCVQEYSCECDYTDLNGNPETDTYTTDEVDRNEAVNSCNMREENLDDIYSDASCSVK